MWDRTLYDLGVDHPAVQKLHELANDNGARGCMHANGIVAKVLDKQGKDEQYIKRGPSAFIMGCIKNALNEMYDGACDDGHRSSRGSNRW